MEHPESDTGYTIQYAKEKPGGTGYDPKPPLPFEIPGDRTGSQDRYRAVRRGSCRCLHLGWLRKPGHDEPALHEAAQALEAACWIAIGKADRVILAGDHHQLPPTIKCIEAEREGLGRTLMQKIAHTKPETVSLLKIQYRMHEDIMRFSSQWFYHNELESAPEVSGRGILRLDTPIVWFDTSECDFTENTREETMSRVNRQEAELLVEQLRSYIQKISKERVLEENIDFGLISPYKAQVQYIRKLIKQDAFFKPLRRLITVHTVDGFQGQERDVILISLVRANEDGKIGFLNDLRRMNVAITRARMKLVILGDAVTLTKHPFYKRLMSFIKKEDYE